LKKIKYYVLYDEKDYPILYFETLKEFSICMGYNYFYLKQKFCNFKENIELSIGNKKFNLYKFEDLV